MEIQHENNEKKGAFRAVDQQVQAGKMTYTWAGDTQFIIDHTEVNPEFSGRGVGKKMLQQAVDFARAKHLKIIPLCPFAKSVFDKTPEFSDVLKS